jgi:hypothetical protein
MKQVDMSEKAIMNRLRQVDKLRTLCLALMKAKKVEKVVAKDKTNESPTEIKDSRRGVGF